ncbi:MAG: phosphoenolpyruvate carboxykinase domain-containing protein, partial [Microbacteriaceae bacterium]
PILYLPISSNFDRLSSAQYPRENQQPRRLIVFSGGTALSRAWSFVVDLEWICRRIDGKAEVNDVPTGRVPAPGSLNLDGLDITPSDLSQLFEVDTAMWSAECDLTEGFFDQFGTRLPQVLTEQLTALRKRLG